MIPKNGLSLCAVAVAAALATGVLAQSVAAQTIIDEWA